jgi:acyl carrier protein
MSEQVERLQRIVTDLSAPEDILQAIKGSLQPRPEQAQLFMEPRTDTERTVAALWADVLGLETVGVEDDFFALGGHSLMVTHILSRVHDIFHVELPLGVVFTQVFTVSELARHIELALMGGAGGDEIDGVLDAIDQSSDQDAESGSPNDGRPKNGSGTRASADGHEGDRHADAD